MSIFPFLDIILIHEEWMYSIYRIQEMVPKRIYNYYVNTNDIESSMQNGMFAGCLAVVVSTPVINQIQEPAIKGRDLFEGREKLPYTYHWSLIIIAQC